MRMSDGPPSVDTLVSYTSDASDSFSKKVVRPRGNTWSDQFAVLRLIRFGSGSDRVMRVANCPFPVQVLQTARNSAMRVSAWNNEPKFRRAGANVEGVFEEQDEAIPVENTKVEKRTQCPSFKQSQLNINIFKRHGEIQ